MCSVQSSLLFVYYVVLSVMLVQYCMWQQDSVYTVYSVSLQRRLSSIAFNASSVQSRISQLLKHSVYRAESVAYIVNGVQCQLGYSLRHSWSAYYYSVMVVFSLVFSCQWGSESIAFSVCSVQGVYCSVGHSPSVLFSVCSVQSTGCSPRVCHVHVMFRVHTLNVLCPCAILEF